MVCEPGVTYTDDVACVPRHNPVFNYFRVIPLPFAAEPPSQDDHSSDEPSLSSHAPAERSASWAAAMAQLRPTPARVGLLYLNLGDVWPPWTHFVLRAAGANRDVDFYFLGAPLDLAPCAHNCARLPLSLSSLRVRIRRHVLNVSAVEHFGSKNNAARL